MTQILVDFNNLTADGAVIGSARYADGPLAVGAEVHAVDFDDSDMVFEATVAEISDDGGQVLLRPRWAAASIPPPFFNLVGPACTMRFELNPILSDLMYSQVAVRPTFGTYASAALAYQPAELAAS